MQEKKPRRLVWACLFVFLVPVMLASLFSPNVLSKGYSSSDPSVVSFLWNKFQTFVSGDNERYYATSRLNKNIKRAVDTEIFSEEDKEPSYIKVPSDSFLDPSGKGIFLVSFLVKFKESPQDRYRIKLITKYDSAAAPYPGWAISLRSQSGTLRPEVYWRGADENGGWYSFGGFDLKLNTWHSFSMLVEDGKFISLFMNDNADSKNINSENSNKIVFLGGYSVDDVEIPNSRGEFKLKAPLPGADLAKVAIKDVIVASKPHLIEKIEKVISAGTSLIRDSFGEDSVHLYIDSQGKDLSRLSRKLDISSKS